MLAGLGLGLLVQGFSDAHELNVAQFGGRRLRANPNQDDSVAWKRRECLPCACGNLDVKRKVGQVGLENA
ncbi:hypothetical protein P3342_007566 [Pyrenophora teres f. teres]|nr:hypothetical protein P3342_007566 [Pyrenophora teres f. teres]